MASINKLSKTCFQRIPCISPCNFLILARNSFSKLVSQEHEHLVLKSEIPEREPIEYEISKCPKEWKFVERLIPPKVVPEPTMKSEYPSGWKPVNENTAALPYYVERSKNHMPGVYLVKELRGQRTRTKIRKINGDIWAMEQDIKNYLEEKHQKNIISQIHEVTRCIWFNGDYVNDVLHWMSKKGL